LIAASVALFIALFGGITIQLASGHDPALSSTSSKAGVTEQSTPATSTSAPASSVAPVTTSQS
jgi:hypothetical protein